MAAFINDVPMAMVFAVIYGAGFGGRVPLTTAIRGDYFGKRAFATITGISMAPLYMVMLVAPLVAAAMFDAQGSYTLSFLILGAIGGISGPLFLFARKPQPPGIPARMSPRTQPSALRAVGPSKLKTYVKCAKVSGEFREQLRQSLPGPVLKPWDL